MDATLRGAADMFECTGGEKYCEVGGFELVARHDSGDAKAMAQPDTSRTLDHEQLQRTLAYATV